jgi:hypothetical protein
MGSNICQALCLGDMAKQVSKLAKAVEGLCSALGPAAGADTRPLLGLT